MTPRVLVLAGGWPAHPHRALARLLAGPLEQAGAEVEIETTLRPLDDPARLAAASVVVPLWTTGRLTWARAEALTDAVAAGTGLAGCHCTADAFRTATLYQFALGGQFVAHPGGEEIEYDVELVGEHPVTRGMAGFRVRSERYYLHVDPSNVVLATTRMPAASGTPAFDMPVVWTRTHGRGRVFYSSIGHTTDVLARPDVLGLTTRGILWAAGQEP
jgi:type 1 glutamine amidotransferase